MGKRQVKNYTDEFRRSSVQLAYESNKSVSEVSRELGINATTLHGWVQKYYPQSTSANESTSNDVHSELAMLRKELSRVKQERDILKKAAAYFAGEMK